MTDSSRLQVVFKRMLKLFDVNTSIPNKTVIFNKVSHDDLCDEIIYWIEQCKLLFGEVVWIQQIQSRQDAGVDIIVDFPNSEIKFGFQIKSYNDIKTEDFSSKVDAQITQSKKHGLSKYFITFAGDLTDKSQNQRTRIKISNLNQLKDDYVISIPPEKLVVIYEAFREQIHPLKFVETDFKSASILALGISESLSNEYRKTTVTIHSQYIISNPEDYPTKIDIGFKLEQSDVHILDEIERVMKTGDKLTIPKEYITKLDVTEIESGKSLIPKGFEISKIEVKGKKGRIAATTILKDVNEKILCSRENFYIGDITKEITKLVSEGKDDPLIISFVHERNNPKDSKFSIKIDPSKGDALGLHNAFNFVSYLNESNKIELEEYRTKKLLLSVTITEPIVLETESHYFKIIERLANIQKKTSQQVLVPENINLLTREEIERIFIISNSLDQGRINIKKIDFLAILPKEEILEQLESFKKTKTMTIELETDFSVNFSKQIINLGKIKYISGSIIPKGNIDELITAIKSSEQDEIEIAFENSEGECIFKYQEIST